jgi:hypothetical protein
MGVVKKKFILKEKHNYVLRRIAKENKISESEVVELAINQLMKNEKDEPEEFDFLSWLSDHAVDMGADDLAENHDQYEK